MSGRAGVLQNFARKYTIAIDDVGFESIPMREKKEDVTAAPADGVYVYGMFIDGCKWDYGSMTLTDSDPKVRASPYKHPSHLHSARARLRIPVHPRAHSAQSFECGFTHVWPLLSPMAFLSSWCSP